jgi:hypothetical protein
MPMQGSILWNSSTSPFKIPASLATRICRIGPFRSGFAGHRQRFEQELVPFHNSLAILFLDTIWRTHDSPEF